jgi:NAD(P) transhydrogenase
VTQHDYDLFVIGSGPAGQRAAIQAAKLGRRVALAEQNAAVGGICINTGTIPSKTLREAVIQVVSSRQRQLHQTPVAGAAAPGERRATMRELLQRVHYVMENESRVVRDQLERNGVQLLWARASFAGPNLLRLERMDGVGDQVVSAAKILIATGTSTTDVPGAPVDGRLVFTSDDVLQLDRVPDTLVVVGAGVIGLEYGSMFAALGTRVTLIDKRRDLLDFVDSEIVAALAYQLRRSRVTLRLGEEVRTLETVSANGQGERVILQLASGKRLVAEQVLFSVGRSGATGSLGLEAVGLSTIKRGLLAVNEHFQTDLSYVYAAGDVVGFPSLAATSMEQGRHAAAHAFDERTDPPTDLLPYGIYTVPEISMVGRTEEELTEEGVPYEVGTAQYAEIARGQILGDVNGLLKLIFHLETRRLLGVHIIGQGATELVHIGQAVIALGGDVDYFLNSVFNYPTLAECYKVAAFDAVNRMSELEGFEEYRAA